MTPRMLTALAAAALCLPVCGWALPAANTIDFSNCMLALPGTTHTAAAQCGFLDVPENPEHPEGHRIRIHVAVAAATSTETAEDPVFFFAGGPGQAASETWVMIRPMLERIRKTRDIVMIDQRGTGQSNRLHCAPPDDTDLNAELDFEEVARLTAECAASLDGDPRYYTTSIAMQDYDRVRRAMGYKDINLMGVSYGTRAAQVYLRQFPGAVRTVTLDSVVPMQLALGQEHALMLDQAVQAVFNDCRLDPQCNALFPAHQQELQDLLDQLREQPRTISVTHPTSGEVEEMLVTADTLAVAVRFLSYSSETQAVLPLLIHEAVSTGNLSRLAAQAILVMSGLNEMLSRGMELSVMCSEDYPFMDLQADHSNTIIGNIFLQAIASQCGAWPQGDIPEGFHEPVQSDVPVLLLSGERDPVTPPQYAAQTAETFSNHLNLVARGQSHSVLRNICLRNVATQFIEQGSVADLDISCVAKIEPSPFFTSLLGPDP